MSSADAEDLQDLEAEAGEEEAADGDEMSSNRYCPSCGHDSRPGALYCVSCGQRLPEDQPSPDIEITETFDISTQPAEDIDDHLMHSVLATVVGLICCGIVPAIPGAVATMYAIRVSDHVITGDLDAAFESSESAGKWLKIAIRLMPVGLVAAIVAFFIIS